MNKILAMLLIVASFPSFAKELSLVKVYHHTAPEEQAA